MKEVNEIARLLLEYYEPDRFKRSAGLNKLSQFSGYSPRAMTLAHQALSGSGLLQHRGNRSDAAYKLTPAGVTSRDAMRKRA